MPRGQGWAPAAALGGAAARGRPWPLGGPPGRPAVSNFVVIKNLYKFWRNSENTSRSGFSKIENSKNRELALGILSIG